MEIRKSKKSAISKPPAHFYSKQLAGEQAPRFETLSGVFQQAVRFFGFQLWELLTEGDLVVLDSAQTGEPCYCSVMGMRGEVRALQVYQGARGYQFFRRAHAGELKTAGDFFATQRSVSVHYVPKEELNSGDRELARALKHNVRGVTPQFRTIRPGYFPWYVTEEEAALLAYCLRGMNWLAGTLTADPAMDLWEKEGSYPKLEPDGEGYQIRMIETQPETLQMPIMPALDGGLLEKIRRTVRAQGPVLEVDHFYAAAQIGKRDERKACVRVAIAIDAATAYAFKPELQMPEASTGEMLVKAVLNAVAQANAIPSEIHVRDKEYRTLLGPLSEALGCAVKLVETLPALDHARGEMLAMMGDPGGIHLA